MLSTAATPMAGGNLEITMNDLLRRKLTGLRQDVTDFAQKLVATASESLHEAAVAELIQAELSRAGFENVFQDEAGNVVGQLIGRQRGPVVLLTGHMDTVRVADDEEPSSLPGLIANGRLFGPGASDCKGGLAAQVYAGALLKRALLPLRGTLVFAATVAEQNGRSVGLRWLLENTLPKLDVAPEFAILGEPTELAIYHGHNGWFEIGIQVSGGDAGQAERASQAIYDEFDRERLLRGIDQQSIGMSVNRPTMSNEGNRRRATIHMTHRLAPNDDVGDIARRIGDVAALATKSIGGVAIDVAVVETNQQLYTGRQVLVRHLTHAWETDPYDPHIARVREALSAGGCEVRHGKWKLGRMEMATGGATLVKEFNVPTIGYGPGDEELSHTSNESVELQKVVDAVYGNALMVHGLVGVPVCGWTTVDDPIAW